MDFDDDAHEKKGEYINFRDSEFKKGQVIIADAILSTNLTMHVSAYRFSTLKNFNTN